jgi:N-acetylglucosaminyl-diphospho-decaprenol L-rhamnosyltransferase
LTSSFDLDLSLVSHGHGQLVVQALDSLAVSLQGSHLAMRVLLTLNLPEPDLERSLQARGWPFALEFIRNPSPLGFGANHNQSFLRCKSTWFAVVNPDVFWPEGNASFWSALQQNFRTLTGSISLSDKVGVVCPDQRDAAGHRQDYARVLMTPGQWTVRVLRRLSGATPSGVADSVAQADWVNGACMFFRAEAFAQVKGFDERYFMYCEDTDICLRLQLAGWAMQGVDWAVVHDARRNTGRSWRHLAWHLRSLLRLWCSDAFWRFVRQSR